MRTEEPSAIGQNLARLRQKAGLSQASLAKLSGVSQQLISQIESGKNTSTKYLPKLAKPLGAAISELDPSFMTPIEDVRMVPVIGYVQAGAFEEAWQWDEETQYEMPVPNDPKYRGYSLLGVETRGNSMNRKYPEGTVLIYTNAIETMEKMRPGRRYIVERKRADGLVEVTVKLLWLDNQGKPWLLPESTDPLHQAPIPLTGDEDDEIRVVGQVRFSISREPD
jgi:transcriptional regulator with XRE-family HTH domain